MILLNAFRKLQTWQRRPWFAVGIVTLLLISPDLNAQQWIASTADKEVAHAHLQSLKEGQLIVVLNTESKKLEELNRLRAASNASNRTKKRAAKQIKKISDERNVFMRDLAQAFDSTYSFSRYCLVFDHDLKDYLDGAHNRTLDTELNYDSNELCAEGLTQYFAREGYIDSGEGARTLSYIVYDSDFNALRFPFPSVKITDVGPALLIRSIFDKTVYRPPGTIVTKFDQLLNHRLSSLEDDLRHENDE